MSSNSQNRRVALLTGAAGGLGEHFADRLARDGYDLVLTDLGDCAKALAKVEAAGRRGVAMKCDLADPAAIEMLVQHALDDFGRVDVLVNNAAYMANMVELDELTGETLRQYMVVNVEAPFLLAKAVVPGMRERGWGRIVNMASGSAWTPVPFMLPYVTSKMGLVGLTRGLACTLARDGITVNSIAPSLTRTSLTDQLPEEFWGMTVAGQMINRPSVPDDLVGVLSFLCSDDARFLTGQTIQANGGAVMLG